MTDIPVLPHSAGHAPPVPLWSDALISASTSALPPVQTTSSSTRAPVVPPKMRSCAVCRLRRVKCEREPGQDECKGCRDRGLRCTPPEGKQKGGLRDGKRVKAAKELYGSSNDSQPRPSSDYLPVIASSATRHTASMAPATDTPFLSYTDVNSRLGTIELQSSVMSNFVEAFLTFKSVTSFDGDINFRLIFDQAGRRVDQLSDANQVLCAALLALGARCSDHPALIGSGAPRIAELGDATRNDVDLRQYGRRRRHTFEQLRAQALQLADEKGVMRMTSPESVAALMLLEGLMDVSASGIRQGRGYGDAYKGQIRTLLAEGQDGTTPRTVQGTIMAWTAYSRDSLGAAFLGLTPTFSDDDAWLLRGQEDPPLPLPERLFSPLAPEAEVNYWTLINSYVEWVTSLARSMPRKLTGPRATKAEKLDESSVAEALEKLGVTFDSVKDLLARTEALTGSTKFLFDATTLVRTLRLMACQLTFVLHQVLHDRLAARPSGAFVGTSLTAKSPDDDYWDRLARLKRDVEALVFRASREIVAILAAALTAGIPLGTHHWLDSRSTELMFKRIPFWAGFIIRAPAMEQGGPPWFDYKAKLSDLRWMLRALRSVGWCSATLASESYEWLSAEVLKLEATRDAFYAGIPLSVRHRGPLAASSYDMALLHPSLTPTADSGSSLEDFLAMPDPFYTRRPARDPLSGFTSTYTSTPADSSHSLVAPLPSALPPSTVPAVADPFMSAFPPTPLNPSPSEIPPATAVDFEALLQSVIAEQQPLPSTAPTPAQHASTNWLESFRPLPAETSAIAPYDSEWG
ncbi:hypothetical protein JCM11641_004383 [Rhodosporidiobolus odoratus]